MNPSIRVGYVSPDYRGNALARFFWPVLANHGPAVVTGRVLQRRGRTR